MVPHLEGHEIAFNISDHESWKKYVRSMHEYLKRESFEWNGDCLYPNFSLLVLALHAGKGSPFVG